MLVGMQRHVPMAETVRKTVEVPPLPFTNKVVDTPIVAQRQISMVRTIQKKTETPQLQCDDQVVDVPAEVAVQAPHVHVVAETAETPRLPLVSKIPQAQIVEKTVEEPQSQIVEKTGDLRELGHCTGGNCGGGRDRSDPSYRIRTTHVRHNTSRGNSSSCC